ncbi:MAG: hypothetical protein GX163_08575 [Bacteroidetes bacterium]|jgi:hypothetical protein|nr:hypothetical protein [Bacteroidota bacterium]
MKIFLQIASILYHPLLIPLIGSTLYFSLTPRFIDWEWAGTHLISISIITIAIPLVSYFILRSLGLVESIYLKNVRERRYPLMILCLLLLLIVKKVLHPYDNPELYFFFIGLLFSVIAALIMVLLKVKVSLHQMGVAALLIFVIGLSVHFKIHLLTTISFLLFSNGWVASSRLTANAHTVPELLVGFFVGALPQFVLYNYWL